MTATVTLEPRRCTAFINSAVLCVGPNSPSARGRSIHQPCAAGPQELSNHLRVDSRSFFLHGRWSHIRIQCDPHMVEPKTNFSNDSSKNHSKGNSQSACSTNLDRYLDDSESVCAGSCAPRCPPEDCACARSVPSSHVCSPAGPFGRT